MSALTQSAEQEQYPFIPNPRTLTWYRLETQRLKNLGLSNKYSRHFTNVLHGSGQVQRSEADRLDPLASPLSSRRSRPVTEGGQRAGRTLASTPARPHPNNKVNSVAPFATLGKPTCGFFFTERTDNKKIKFGIPPSDLVKWRCDKQAAITH